MTPSGLAEPGTFVKGVGPVKNRVIPVRPDGSFGDPTSLVGDAHAAGPAVHRWTLRAENQFLPLALWEGSDIRTWVDKLRLPASDIDIQGHLGAGGPSREHVARLRIRAHQAGAVHIGANLRV